MIQPSGSAASLLDDDDAFGVTFVRDEVGVVLEEVGVVLVVCEERDEDAVVLIEMRSGWRIASLFSPSRALCWFDELRLLLLPWLLLAVAVVVAFELRLDVASLARRSLVVDIVAPYTGWWMRDAVVDARGCPQRSESWLLFPLLLLPLLLNRELLCRWLWCWSSSRGSALDAVAR